MLRTLLWKEWRQLRMLRWVGFGLGAALPLVALTAPAAARQGWVPLAGISRSYSAVEILMEALPVALAFGLWPLVALLTTVQTFSGDRATGTEGFLLERPVARDRVWVVRMIVSFGSTMVVVAGSLLVWLLFVKAGASPQAGDWSEALQMLGFAGSATTVSCLLAGMMAASFMSAPLAALLLGVVLAAVPVALATTLGGWFSLATFGHVPVGMVVSAFFLLAYPVGSFIALCRGEPAGRGRVVRGVVTLVACLAVVLLLFVISATTAIRVMARQLPYGAGLVASPAGGSLFAESFGGWIIDLESAEKTHFLPPPVQRAAWSQDGKRLAVLTLSGPLGSQTSTTRVEFFDRGGDPAGRVLELDENEWAREVRWVRDRIVLVLPTLRGQSRIIVYSPDTGETSGEEFELASWNWRLVGPTLDGRLFLAIPKESTGDYYNLKAYDHTKFVTYALYGIDTSKGRVEPEPLLEEVGRPWFADRRLSPSGRYWVRDQGARRTEVRPVLDLETGREVHVEGLNGSAVWMKGDVLVWLETEGKEKRLEKARPGEAPTTLRTWSDLRVSVEVSPDAGRLLVHVLQVLEEKPAPAFGGSIIVRQKVLETWAYDLTADQWIELSPWPAHEYEGHAYKTLWAGPRTVARTGPGILALASLDRPGEFLPVIGP